jgi:uncharacterized membrane protein
LAGEGESQPRGTRETVPHPRIQTLSDLIFGLALSIGALTLISEKPSSSIDLAGTLIGFGWAFLILALVWVRYTSIMSVLPVETGRMIAANLLLLFLVSVEPYLYNLIAVSFSSLPGQLDSGIATTAYAADMGAMFLVLAYFSNEVTIEEKRLIPKELLKRYKLMRNSTIVTAALFLVSMLPIFWGVVVFGLQTRFILWMGTFVTWMARREAERRSSPLPHSVGARTRLSA